MSDQSKKSQGSSIQDSFLMNSYTYFFCIAMLCFGVFFVYNSYSLEGDINSSNCNSQTAKTLLSVMQIYSWIMVVLSLIILEGTLFGKYFDIARIVFLVLIVVYTITMIVCSVIIKNNLTSSCLGSYYNGASVKIYNNIYVSSIGLILLSILYGVCVGFNFPKYYESGKVVLVSDDIVIRKLSQPDKNGNQFYPQGLREKLFDDEGYKKIFKSIHPDPVICAPPPKKKQGQKIEIIVPPQED